MNGATSGPASTRRLLIDLETVGALGRFREAAESYGLPAQLTASIPEQCYLKACARRTREL